MKISTNILTIIAAVLLHSCNNSISNQHQTKNLDIPKFIADEAQRLQQLNPTITKTVTNGKSKEVKLTQIANWEKELAHFAATDINASGNAQFDSHQNGDTLVFTSNHNPKNKVIVKILLLDNYPIELTVQKTTQNLLFVNNELLEYKVGKMYSIDKKQQVKGLGNNSYTIKGEF